MATPMQMYYSSSLLRAHWRFVQHSTRASCVKHMSTTPLHDQVNQYIAAHSTGQRIEGDTFTPQQVLGQLKCGNAAYSSGDAASLLVDHLGPHVTESHRQAAATHQTPIATVLTCSDSRVSPELLFGCGIGALFVVRNAGNIVSTEALASIEVSGPPCQPACSTPHARVRAVRLCCTCNSSPGHHGPRGVRCRDQYGACCAAVRGGLRRDEAAPRWHSGTYIVRSCPQVCRRGSGAHHTGCSRCHPRVHRKQCRRGSGGCGHAKCAAEQRYSAV